MLPKYCFFFKLGLKGESSMTTNLDSTYGSYVMMRHGTGIFTYNVVRFL